MIPETREQKVLRALYHLARVKVREFPTGPGAVIAHAKALAKPLMGAPITGRWCLAYELNVYYYQGRWIHALEEYVSSDFLVSDDTGKARVIGKGADLALGHRLDLDTRYNAADLRKFLSPRNLAGIPATSWFIAETVLKPNDQVVVAGVGAREPDPDQREHADFRNQPRTRPRIERGQDFPLLISNSPLVFATSHEEVVVPS